MATRPLGAQISHMLKDRGVTTIFGIPGVHNQEMYRGIEEAGITHILARHEQGAGFMADGYARATGQPGVAYVISGPGLCNIMTPMGQAYSDSVPMLVLSSVLDETEATRGQFTNTACHTQTHRNIFTVIAVTKVGLVHFLAVNFNFDRRMSQATVAFVALEHGVNIALVTNIITIRSEHPIPYMIQSTQVQRRILCEQDPLEFKDFIRNLR